MRELLLGAGWVAIGGLAMAVMLRTVALNPFPIAAPGDVFAASGLGRIASGVPGYRLAGPLASPGAACQLDIAALAAQRAVLVVAAVRGSDIVLRAPAGGGCGDGLMLLTGVTFEQLTMVEPPHPG